MLNVGMTTIHLFHAGAFRHFSKFSIFMAAHRDQTYRKPLTASATDIFLFRYLSLSNIYMFVSSLRTGQAIKGINIKNNMEFLS